MTKPSASEGMPVDVCKKELAIVKGLGICGWVCTWQYEVDSEKK
jgi:hypothetical protein